MIRLFKLSNNKSSIIGIFLAVIVIIAFVYLRLPQRKEVILSAYPEIAQVDLDKNYPATALDLIEYNNKVIFAMYGGGIKDTEIALAFARQRKLFASELIELNPFEDNLVKLTEDIVKNKSAQKYIVGFETGEATYDGVNDSICTVEVLQKTNTAVEYLVKYHLITENGKWKILAWESTARETAEK